MMMVVKHDGVRPSASQKIRGKWEIVVELGGVADNDSGSEVT